MRRYFQAPAFSLLILLGGCSPHLNLNAPFGSRPPNGHEVFYTAVAADFGDSKICKKISRRALDEEGPGMSGTGWQVSLQRSECYFYAALKTHDAKLCDSVEKIVTIPSNKSRFSRSECLVFLNSSNSVGDEPAMEYSSLGGIMKEMGYREEEAKLFLANDKAFDWFKFYMYQEFGAQPEKKQEFLKRVEALPSFIN
jgi:hypothetical protein